MKGRTKWTAAVLCLSSIVASLLAVAGPAPPAGATGSSGFVSLGDVSVIEPSTGKLTVRLPVSLSQPQPFDTYLSWHLVAGTATGGTPNTVGADYYDKTGNLRIRAGKTYAAIAVAVLADTTIEADETFTVELSTSTNPDLELRRPVGTITILDDDTHTGPAQLGIGDTTTIEGNTGRRAAKATLTLNQPQPFDTYIHWHTTDGTAANPDDYRNTTRTTRIRAGKTTANTTVTIYGDTTPEPLETLTIHIDSTDPPTPTWRDTATITIRNDDPTPHTTPYDFTGNHRTDPMWTDRSAWYLGDDPSTWWEPPSETFDGDFAPGDYDGDGIWEPAYLAPGWDWVTAGAAGTIHFQPAPVPGESGGPIFVPADYDGDGRTDPAYWSYGSGYWYIQGREPIQFGTGGYYGTDPQWYLHADMPVPADYDGDGTTDLAIYSPRTGEWKILGQDPVVFGGPGWLPVPADYDGDGADDFAATAFDGSWCIEGQGCGAQPFGAGEEPVVGVAGDFDGDGRSELSWFAFTSDTSIWLLPDRTIDLGRNGLPIPLSHTNLVNIVRVRLVWTELHPCCEG